MEINRQIAQLLLENEGYAVDMAENGKEAVDMIAEAPEDRYYAILMDVQMPVMDGYEATEMIRKMDGPVSRIPIIALTANAFEEDIRKAIDAGMDGHIAKPIDSKKIKEVLDGIGRNAE